MTQGERLVWAAAFVKQFTISNPPIGHTPDRDNAWAEWERAQTVSAVEYASAAVLLLRTVRDDVAEGFEGFDTSQWLDEMLAEDS
jgi:hypothetical protein